MPGEVYMRDEEYLFKEDVREKAITARSAKKRPRHSGCRLPQYTAKEMREMSGPTYTLNLKKRITYAEFKALPEGLQKSYVQNIIDKYHVGPSALAELMGATHGMGYYVQNSITYANYTHAVAGIFVIGIVVTILNFLVGKLQKWAIRWH